MLSAQKKEKFSFFKNHFLHFGIIIFFAIALYGFVEPKIGFTDPDSYYHVALSQKLFHDGIIREFPWTQWSMIRDHFVDHHFLYHIFLIPFVQLAPNPIFGAKLATVVLGTLFLLLFYKILSKKNVRGAVIYTLLLATTSPFLFRTALTKGNTFSLIFLFVGITLLFERKNFLLFIFSFFYVWAYGGWPIFAIFTLCFIFTSLKFQMPLADQHPFRLFLKKENFKMLLSVFGGLFLGLIINPFFPNTLFFFWNMYQKIILSYGEFAGRFGREWYGFPFWEIISRSLIFFIIFTVAITVFLITKKKQSQENRFLFLVSFLFYGATLYSSRYGEYFFPIGFLFSALVLGQKNNFPLFERIYSQIKVFLKKNPPVGFTIATFFVLLTFFYISASILGTKLSLAFTVSRNEMYHGAALWLNEHLSSGTLIFHPSWDEFPPLYFYAPSLYYISGLDPRLMFTIDPIQYLRWENIANGIHQRGVSSLIEKHFSSSWVIVSNRYPNFEKALQKDPRIIKQYADKEARVYEILRKEK